MSRAEAEPQFEEYSHLPESHRLSAMCCGEAAKAGGVALRNCHQRRFAVGVTQGEIEFGCDITHAAL